MTGKITPQDEKLLRREGYIRRERHVCISGGILWLLAAIITPLFDRWHYISDGIDRSGIGFALFMFGYAYFCTMRLRHIESIKHYQPFDVSAGSK